MHDLQVIQQIPAVPPRPREAHKGTFGTVIVIGGCETMMGAPALSATAALRSGAGLVKIATIAAAMPAALTIEPSATGIILTEDAASNVHQLDTIDPRHEAVLAIGPGLGQRGEMRDLIAALLQGKRTIVLDADGLNLLAPMLVASPFKDQPLITAPLILTPHPGEFQRLASALNIPHSPVDSATRPAAAAALALRLGAVVLLKGASSVVSDGSRVFINTTGNPALATAGSGDVLTGVVAALIAQKLLPFEAACLASHLHGLAADLWATVHGTSGLIARDLATLLPDAFNHCRST